MANRVRPIAGTEADRHELERLQRSPTTPAGLSRRARAVLLMLEGLSGVEVALRTGYTVVQISRLRRRFAHRLWARGRNAGLGQAFLQVGGLSAEAEDIKTGHTDLRVRADLACRQIPLLKEDLGFRPRDMQLGQFVGVIRDIDVQVESIKGQMFQHGRGLGRRHVEPVRMAAVAFLVPDPK